jgi:hypothetical protein
MAHQNNWLLNLGKHIRERLDGSASGVHDPNRSEGSLEALPQQWLDLLRLLDEQERNRKGKSGSAR